MPPLSPEPVVRLVRHFERPLDLAVASARTCYAPRVVTPEEVSGDEASRARRDRIAESIYEAGHHTTFQHATFTFVLERVSRQFIWSFLHSHPFYNSEQVSQRYVEVRPGCYAVPSLSSDEARAVYEGVVAAQMAAYARLTDALGGVVEREYKQLFPHRDARAKRWAGVRHKKQMEIARYVLPVATHAHLYHTISGITLHRYLRICEQYDVPEEQRFVVQAMGAAVREKDAEYLRLAADPLPLRETPEWKMIEACAAGRATGSAAYLDEFDASLGGRVSRLVGVTADAEETLAAAVRDVLGLSRTECGDAEAIESVLDPARNVLLGDALNLTTHGKLTRALGHVHLTFRKKLSHTADSQDQRHRMTPGSRPVLGRHFVPGRPDYIVPGLILADAACRAIYDGIMRTAWDGMGRLLDMGERLESVLYLLPNAFPIRFVESGDLLGFHHKWTKRLCYTAQEEIWAASRDEVTQVATVLPRVAPYLEAPCGLRRRAGETPYCPEGDRFCGVPVWRLPVARYERVL